MAPDPRILATPQANPVLARLAELEQRLRVAESRAALAGVAVQGTGVGGGYGGMEAGVAAVTWPGNSATGNVYVQHHFGRAPRFVIVTARDGGTWSGLDFTFAVSNRDESTFIISGREIHAQVFAAGVVVLVSWLAIG